MKNNDSFYRGDLHYMDRQYKKLGKNKELMFETLDAMLDVATLLPLCENEYPDHIDSFRVFEEVYLALDRVRDLLGSYGLNLQLSPLISSKAFDASAKDR